MKPLAIDLFSGCGGLSAGLRAAGFDIGVAVEVDATAISTYKQNFPRVNLFDRDIKSVSAEEVRRAVRGRPIDLVAGCAPCQGFCSLTAKNARPDPRNELLMEMARLVVELSPRLVFMENVPGLLMRGRAVFNRFTRALESAGYKTSYANVQMADYGIPQSRRRFVLLASRDGEIEIPPTTHARIAVPGKKLPWLTVRDAIGSSPKAIRLSNAIKLGGPRKFNWNVVRDIRPNTRARLAASRPGGNWLSFEEAIRPDCHRGDYVGFTNVYGRMRWDRPAPTITSGCTTPAKGRFGHPDRRKTTISVRDAATLQTFPLDFEIATDQMDAACLLLGNAVPPRFAEIVASHLRKTL